MKKIGILIERQRAFGRQLCSGIVQYAQTCDDWSLTMLDWDDLTGTSHLKGFDGFIVRVTNDDIAKTFAQTGKPLVDVFEGCTSQPFVKVIQDATRISQLAVRHFILHHFSAFGNRGVMFVMRRCLKVAEVCGRVLLVVFAGRLNASPAILPPRIQTSARGNVFVAEYLRHP